MERDDLDDYLDDAMRDPSFAYAFAAAEWFSARWHRRVIRRHAPLAVSDWLFARRAF